METKYYDENSSKIKLTSFDYLFRTITILTMLVLLILFLVVSVLYFYRSSKISVDKYDKIIYLLPIQKLETLYYYQNVFAYIFNSVAIIDALIALFFVFKANNKVIKFYISSLIVCLLFTVLYFVDFYFLFIGYIFVVLFNVLIIINYFKLDDDQFDINNSVNISVEILGDTNNKKQKIEKETQDTSKPSLY